MSFGKTVVCVSFGILKLGELGVVRFEMLKFNTNCVEITILTTISNSKYFFKGQTTREKVISLSFSIESYLDPVGLATVKLKNSFVQWASQTGSLYSQWCFLLPIPLKQT